MARFDKYDPVSGGYRAKLGFTPVAGDVGKVIPVSINGSGQAIKSVDGTSCQGVVCMDKVLSQNQPVDVMTDGEIVDVNVVNTDVTGAAAGVLIKAGAGVTTNAGSGQLVGRMVEAWRLVVRLGRMT